tara:strand:- start:702 stop:1130 length:429 start_codon:yes stop_codon:yes gene_type:complete
MIKYSLKCQNCNIEFDSWFSSSNEFDRIKKLNLINCASCGSLKVRKSLMSPNLVKKNKLQIDQKNQKIKDIKNKLIDYQKFVKENFKFVGDNFAYEARSVHYNNNKKEKKGIYGNASLEEVKELKEEGIETETIPWIDEKEN